MVMQYKVGLGNVGSYQVSGKPWASGSLDATRGLKLEFPTVTRWVQVNNGATALNVGFSASGVGNNTNYLTVPANSTLGPVELKVTELHLSGGTADAVSVMAGLTFIPVESINNTGVSTISPNANWSGSAGVG